MSLETKTINYIDPADFIYDNTKVLVDGTGASLVLQDDPLYSEQEFDDPTGFTSTPPTGVEFRSFDTDIHVWSDYATDINLDLSDGAKVPTSTQGSPVITSGKLDLSGTNQNVVYDISNSWNPNKGAIKFKECVQ